MFISGCMHIHVWGKNRLRLPRLRNPMTGMMKRMVNGKRLWSTTLSTRVPPAFFWHFLRMATLAIGQVILFESCEPMFERNFFLTPNSKNSFLCHTKTGFGSSGHFIRIPTYFFASNSSVARWMDCEANLQPCLQGHVGGQEDCEPWVCGWWQFAPCQNSAGNADHWPLATEGFKVGQRSGPFRFVPDQGCDKVSDVE